MAWRRLRSDREFLDERRRLHRLAERAASLSIGVVLLVSGWLLWKFPFILHLSSQFARFNEQAAAVQLDTVEAHLFWELVRLFIGATLLMWLVTIVTLAVLFWGFVMIERRLLKIIDTYAQGKPPR